MFRPARLAATAMALLTGASVALSAQNRPNATKVARPERPVWPDEGPRTWAPRPTVASITANDLRTRLYQFADDSMQGRRIGEKGNFKGTEYIAGEFKRFGLKPAGDSGTYFQTLPFGPTQFDSSGSSLMIGATALSAKRDWIPTAPSAQNGFGGKAELNGVPAVFAGTWGDTAVMLDPEAFKGKVAVFLAAPGAGASGGVRGPASFVSCADVPNKFGVNAILAADKVAAATPARPAAPAAAAGARDPRARRAGAVAVLVIGLEEMTPATVNAAFEGRNGMRPTTALNADAPAGATISRKTAEQLFGKPIDQVTVGTVGQPITASWNQTWRPAAYAARNVIAVLPGSDPTLKEEYVLVGAHNDHVGINTTVVDHDSLRATNFVTRRQGSNDPTCIPTAEQQVKINALIAKARASRPARKDSIMNGADDDGSGSMVLLELAERFAKEKPARSVIFVSHQGEEGGLLGSRWFVDNPTIPIEKVVAAHNMDMVGKGRVDQVKFGGPNSVQMLGARRLSRDFGDIIDSVNANSPEPMAIDKSWDIPANPLNRFCRSDQVNYVRKNIPVVYMSLGYGPDYHMQSDEPQYIDYDHAARLGRFVHDVMTAVANRKEKPEIGGADPTYPSCNR
ncbi:M28 family peptidase [Gemmatimonas groenlandica]|uniref:M28 family peptidase n=1 Tax=Gemmatimonas groenlandica TaxID=2732249 RepID=A0A6M4IT93_9BACT|nr:M28 family peptidase [Gemmatimonas groenlandica]QJR37435.1 M28 family peptidase [Gemmatimonas groenlandica]